MVKSSTQYPVLGRRSVSEYRGIGVSAIKNSSRIAIANRYPSEAISDL